MQAVYSRHNDIVLGDGESIDGGPLHVPSPFHGPSATTAARSLHTPSFNTNRWIFGPNSYVEYHHRVEGFPQRTAAVEVAVGHYESGRLLIEVSKDRDHYIPLGYIEKTQEQPFPFPRSYFPRPTCGSACDPPLTNPRLFKSSPTLIPLAWTAIRRTWEGGPLSLPLSTDQKR